MNDLDLEEIESHLYSQIYHSNEDNDLTTANLPPENFQEPNNMKKPNRYFRSSPISGGTKFQNKHQFTPHHSLKASPRSDYYQQQQGIYSKNYERPQKRDISINQLVVLSAPQQPPIVCMANSNSRNKRARWRDKLKEKRRKQRLAEKLTSPKPTHVKEVQAKNPAPRHTIIISDSEEESCVELPNNWPVVSVTDSDDDNKNTSLKQEPDNEPIKSDEQTDTLTDDVIFVEPVNESIEVINLDEETEKNSDVSIETGSVASTNSFLTSTPSKAQTAKHVHQERKELLSTPDSASNDFMASSGSVDLNQASFNFSLHGKDFDNDKFIKPTNPTERCETESSSSTTDNNTVNLMKTAVFNEIEFPKEDMFSEDNLESFGNLITPSRRHATRASTPVEEAPRKQDSSDSSSETDFRELLDKQKELLKSCKNLPDLSPMTSEMRQSPQQVVTRKNKKSRASTPVEESPRKQDSSDSSSETDFRELLDKQKELLKSCKNLPDLSPMTSEMRQSPQQVVTRKNRKSKNLSSKYDLIEAISEQKTKKKRKSAQSNEVSSDSNSKKKNKSKKRKTEISSMEETETNTDSEVKRKSRKLLSPSLDDSENLDGNEGRKKAKTKKKKSFTPVDSEDNLLEVELQKTSVDSSAESSSSKEQTKTGTKKKKNFSSADSEDNLLDVELQRTSTDFSASELSSKEQTKTGTKKRKSFSPADSEDNLLDVESQRTFTEFSASELSSKEQTKTGTKKKKNFSSADSEDNLLDVELQRTSTDFSASELSSKEQAKTGTKKRKSFSPADSEDNLLDVESQRTSTDFSASELSSKEQTKTGTKKRKSFSPADSEDNLLEVESQKTSTDSSAVELSSREQSRTATKKKKGFSSADSEDNLLDVESQKTSADSSAVEVSSRDQSKAGTKKKKSSFPTDSEDNFLDVESQKTDSSALELSLNEEQIEAGETSDQSQSKKKTKGKKKKSFSGAESEDNVTDIEPIIPSQEASETQGQETTENTLPCDDVKIKTEKIDDQTTDQTNQNEGSQLEVPVVKSEDSESVEAKGVVTTEENVAECSGDSVQIEELSEDCTVVDEVKKEFDLVILSDSDSNLSGLEGQQDIQLNLEDPTTQNKNASSAVLRNPAINLVDNTLEEVQQAMSNDPELWTILDSDRMPTRLSLSGRRCNRCRERGHVGIRCPNKVVPKCKLCGECGHYEPRCPNRICTQCGERSNYSTTYCKFCFRFRKWKCPICYLIGHNADSCPDLWRRYHLTTTDGPLRVPHTGPALKPRNQLWCSGCARSGHLEFSCRFYQSVYPPADPSIKRYDDIYENYNTEPQVVSPFVTGQFSGGNGLLPTPPFLQLNQPAVYNQSINYQYPNNGLMPMYPENRQVWINQGNMLPPPPPPRENQQIHDINVYPAGNPSNSQGYYEFNFQDNLPNFISFEPTPPPPPSNNNYGNLPLTGRYFDNNALVDEMRHNFASNGSPRPINQNDGVDAMRHNLASSRPPRPINQNDGVDEMRHNLVSGRPPRPINQNDCVEEMRHNLASSRPSRPINQQNDGVDESINTFLSNVPRHQIKQHMSLFFSSSTAAIQNFISGELAKLIRVSLNLKSVVSHLRKQVLETGSLSKMKKCYRKLNMVLFGIYQLNEGGKHLIRLKNCRLEPKNSKLSQQRRQDLFRSYLYIFGNQKQANYIKLLRKI